jgi:hypothetical protein
MYYIKTCTGLNKLPEPCIDPKENSIQERLDADGTRWAKKYVGNGAHMNNWLLQYCEVYGEENVLIEEIAAPKSSCYGQSGEKLFRIWVKEKKPE